MLSETKHLFLLFRPFGLVSLGLRVTFSEVSNNCNY